MKLFIEFTRPKKFAPLSYVIRAIQGTPYSHVRLRWVNSVGVNIVYEASGSNVHFLGPMAQSQKPVHVAHSFCYTLSREQYRELIKVCMSYAGINYGVLQLLGIGVARLFGLRKNPFSRGESRVVCSELVGIVILDILGITFEDTLDLLGPKEVLETLLNT